MQVKRMYRRRLAGISFLAILLLLPLKVSANTPTRNIILITIDTLRGDYLSCNGSSIVQTPNLDALAAGGVNFQNARAPVPLTLPSHVSILTSMYPHQHGVRDNATFRLDEKYTTLAEILKKQGYRTASFVGSFVLDRRFGLAQGFDVYEDKTWTDTAMLENYDAERNAEAVFQAFHSWFEKEKGRPLFIWIHLYDPHAPYNPPPPFAGRFAKNRYAGEVAYTDQVIGKIMQSLRSAGIYDKSVIAVVGDHGEALGDHGEQTHSVLIYNATLRVPMILNAPGLIKPGSRYSALTRTIDLAPTLLDYVGIATKVGSGVSLRKGIENGTSIDVTAQSESLYAKLNLGWSELFGIEDGQYHYIRSPNPELFDLKVDPGEKTNIIGKQPQIAKKLNGMIAMQNAVTTQATPLSEEEREKLEALGYVSSSRASASAGIPQDPKSKIAVWNEIQASVSLNALGKHQQAVEILEKQISREQDMPILYDYLGNAYIKTGRWSDTERIYRQALSRGLKSASFHVGLGQALVQRKEFAEAEKEFKAAVLIEPLNVSAYYHLGNAYRAQRRLNEAEMAYREALKINPSYVYARNSLGMTLAALKRDEEALAEFQASVAAAPKSPESYFNLAIQQERMNRNKEALGNYQKFLKLSNDKEYAEQRKRALAALQRLQM